MISAPTENEKKVLKMTEHKCGDCFYADLCEESKMLVGFSRDNSAYCGMFLNCADVVPMRHGRWIMGTGENGLQTGYRKCSRCGEIVKYGYSLYGVHNFCNYCGAKMDERNE